jgi:hypothetical protein
MQKVVAETKTVSAQTGVSVLGTLGTNGLNNIAMYLDYYHNAWIR